MEDRPPGWGEARDHDNGYGRFTRCVPSKNILWSVWALGRRWLWSCQKGGLELWTSKYLTKKKKSKLFREKLFQKW